MNNTKGRNENGKIMKNKTTKGRNNGYREIFIDSPKILYFKEQLLERRIWKYRNIKGKTKRKKGKILMENEI